MTVHRIFLDFKKKYIKGYINYYNERGLKINDQDINSIANDIEFDVFITNYLDKDSTVNRRYFELSSENHMMAIVIDKNSQTELVKYAFFDPNYGVIYFDDKEKFKQFLTYIIKERKDIYNFLVYDNNTYITSIIELENDPVINKNNIFPIIESDLVNITTTKILCDEQSFFYLSDNQKLQFKKFHQQSASTELELISDGEQYKAISIVINSVDSSDILALITNQYKNILKFNYDKIYLKIENDKCIVYKINHNVKLLANQPLPISDLSEPITEFTLETLPVESLEIHKNEVLGQDTVKLDQWWDPRVEPEKIPSHSSAVKTKLAESNYRHNLIIQLEGENIVSQSTANLIGKHPDNTTVIQYDLEQNRYRVVYGDINKVAGERTRWFLIGHGRKDDITKKRTFARKTAEYIADKLMHLRKPEFNNSEPEKIVLLGCKLGQAKIGDNFALDFSQQLWNEGFNSTITAYTRDLYIGSHGRKNIYLNNFERSRRDARYYKTTFDKQLSPLGLQINNEILIFYILRLINSGELSLDSETIKNNDYIKQYFHLPNGKLDIDLLKLVAYDARAYELFYQCINENRHNYTIDDFLNKLWAEKIFDPPLWKTINQTVIKKNLYSVKQNNIKKIIFRFSDKQKYCQQAELLASENPNDSFIFQVDKKTNKIFLEYGDLDKLKNSVIDKWMIVGEIELHNHFLLFEQMTVEKLVDIMDNIHKQNFLAIPDEICFFSKKALGTLSSPYDTSGIASEFSIKLAERNINTAITTYQVNPDLFSTRSLDGVNEYFDLVKNNNQLTKFRYDKTTKQLFYNELNTAYALFFDIMKGNINIEKDLEQYQFYLNNYLYDNKGKLITKRIENIKYDPIINRKVNNYFNSKMEQQPDALVKWEEIFTNNNEMLNVKAHHLSLLLENIYYRPEIINHLSDYSNQLLGEIYSYSDGSPDIGRLMLLVNDQPRLNQLRTSLIELSAIDNRSGLYTLPLSVALSKSQKWHNYYLNNILLLTKITNNNANIIIKPMPHAFYLEKRANLEKCIGIFYASLSSKVDNVDDILQYHHRLLESSATRRLSIDEQLFLDKLNQAVDWAAYLVVNENGLTEQANIILPENLTLAPITQYQLSINNVTFTLIVKYKGNTSYQCRIFDPRMGEIVINNIAKEKINEEVISFLTNYLNQDVTVFDTVYKRYEIFDINKDIALSGQFKVHKIHENDIIKIKVNDLIEFLPVKENLTDFYKNVTIAEQNIGLFALKRAGAHINENLISPFMIRNIPDWRSKLKFDIEQLNDYLTFSQGTEENISIIKLLKEKINSSENYRDFLFNRGDLHDVATIYQRLAAIDQYVDANTVDGELWHNFQQGMTRLPRYAHIVNKLSNATQLANIIQLISSTQSALIYLNDPQVSIQERQDIEKNLIIAWGAGITNFGTELLQPILLKLAYQMTGSIDTASRFAVRMSLGINIASSGFDLYYAYQNFDQLQDEINPAKRQDLIVNGTLSLLSAGINISSALAILAGVSSAGPIGLFLGTGLMISNSFYNAYRTVEEIEEKVALTTSEEWETGFRAILGLQPDYSVRNKLLKQQTYSEIKEYKIEKEKKLFTELLKPSGYNLSIVVDEDEQVSELPLYHLFDKKTNLYLFKNKNKNVQYDLEALKHNFNILTLPINLWKQQQIDNIIEINKKNLLQKKLKRFFINILTDMKLKWIKLKLIFHCKV
ncbi:MAG TPA: C80 family cysteine peptidase [Arsenophonus nasoniae]|uniref:C80 family cysteine peptidase n=1 Tax=Arsenophonus nasoniae TaxID=638 RepID=UPI0038799791